MAAGPFDLRYLAVGPVDLVDHIGQQDLLLHSAAEFLIFGVLAHLQVVSFEGLVHAAVEEGEKGLSTGCQRRRAAPRRRRWETDSLITSLIEGLN